MPAMLEFSMHYESIRRVSQFRDNSIVKLTQFAQLYGSTASLVSNTFTSEAESCFDLAKPDELSEFLSSTRHFSSLSSYAEVKKINSIDLKKHAISFDVLFMDTARMQNLLEPDQYGVQMITDCSFSAY